MTYKAQQSTWPTRCTPPDVILLKFPAISHFVNNGAKKKSSGKYIVIVNDETFN